MINVARLEKDALLSKISQKLSDNEDLAIELMEDVSDSIDSSEELKKVQAELESKNKAYDELKKSYKERFLDGSPTNNAPKFEELEEVQYVNCTEL